MKAIINEMIFEDMLDACKNGVAKTDERPALKYIRLKVESGTITAMVCDGYSGARFKFEAWEHDGEDFVCLIKPIQFKASRSGASAVTIELIGDKALLSVPTEYGNLTYNFKQAFEYDKKLDDIFDKMKNHDREIAMNSSALARIMNSFAKVLSERNKPVVIETKGNNKEGIRMFAKGKNFEFEQFLLPLRM